MEYQELPAVNDSDVMSANNSGTIDDDSTYFGSRKNLPVMQNTTPDLSEITKDAKNILKVFDEGLAKLPSSMVIFAQDNELESTKIGGGGGGEETQTNPPLEND